MARCPICAESWSARTNRMVYCEDPSCGVGYHQLCLTPPLLVIPDGEWLRPQHEVDDAGLHTHQV